MVTLPASGDCFGIRVMSGEERVLPREKCDAVKKRAILITSSEWKMVKRDIQTNCQNAKCKQITGAADGLFIAIDEALQKVPIP